MPWAIRTPHFSGNSSTATPASLPAPTVAASASNHHPSKRRHHRRATPHGVFCRVREPSSHLRSPSRTRTRSLPAAAPLPPILTLRSLPFLREPLCALRLSVRGLGRRYISSVFNSHHELPASNRGVHSSSKINPPANNHAAIPQLAP